jgi:hypothetical protein
MEKVPERQFLIAKYGKPFIEHIINALPVKDERGIHAHTVLEIITAAPQPLTPCYPRAVTDISRAFGIPPRMNRRTQKQIKEDKKKERQALRYNEEKINPVYAVEAVPKSEGSDTMTLVQLIATHQGISAEQQLNAIKALVTK